MGQTFALGIDRCTVYKDFMYLDFFLVHFKQNSGLFRLWFRQVLLYFKLLIGSLFKHCHIPLDHKVNISVNALIFFYYRPNLLPLSMNSMLIRPMKTREFRI